MKKVKPFIETIDYTPSSTLLEQDNLRQQFIPPVQQTLSIFDTPQMSQPSITA